MKPQKEPFEDLGAIAEAAGREEGVPMTPDQEVHLDTWDVKIALWMEEMNKAMKKQEDYKQYVSRTHDYKNYDRG